MILSAPSAKIGCRIEHAESVPIDPAFDHFAVGEAGNADSGNGELLTGGSNPVEISLMCPMEVGVKVFSENTLTGERKHTTTAYVTFVAIDSSTREPKAVSPLILKTAEEKRRWREAGERRKVRLAMRYKKQRSRD